MTDTLKKPGDLILQDSEADLLRPPGAEADIVDIFLHPGDHYWGAAGTRIRTILGSCVAICMWHPQSHEGGMCHIMLPTRPKRQPGHLDPRYADEALLLLLDEINHSARPNPSEYEVKIFGGGRMFPVTENAQIIGEKNIQTVRHLLKRYHLPIKSESLGGDFHRKISFELGTGDVLQQKRLLTAIR